MQEIRLLKDEVAILKNQKPKPKIGPSGLEKTARANGNNKQREWSKGSKNKKVIVDYEQVIDFPDGEKPNDAVFKGYAELVATRVVMAEIRLSASIKHAKN